MGMFDTYDNDKKRICNDSDRNYTSITDTLPNKIYNIKHNFVGYSWHTDDVFDWKITVNKKIKVSKDSYIYTQPDEMPDTATEGYLGQKAYNVVDIKSWTCVGLIEDFYVWVADKTFIYPIVGDVEIELTPSMINKTFSISFYDYKWNIIRTIEDINSNTFTCKIGTDVKELNKTGIYYVLTRINDGVLSKVDSCASITIL